MSLINEDKKGGGDYPSKFQVRSSCLCRLLAVSFSIVLTALFPCLTVQADDDIDFQPDTDISLADASALSSKADVPTVSFTPVHGKPVIDGKLDEKFWQQARKFELDKEIYPIRFAPADIDTSAFVALTHNYLYVGFIAVDPEPKWIRSAIRGRDGVKNDDYVSIAFSPSVHGSKKYEFRVNPHGILTDLLQDTVSGRYLYDWDTLWDGAAHLGENGYSVEMAIPLPSVKTAKSMDKGVAMLKRSYPRRVDRYFGTFFMHQTLADKKQDPAAGSDGDQAQRKERHILQITPHYIFDLDEVRDEDGVFSQVGNKDEHGFGFDATYNFSHQHSAAFTVLPNYTDVEADVARDSINNKFLVIQPEKRQFFQGVSESFTSLVKTVYSRNIIQPELGVENLWSGSSNSLGFFLSNDKETYVYMPDNLGLSRVMLDDNSISGGMRSQHQIGKNTLGLTATYRGGEDYDSGLVSIDGMYDFGTDDKLRYHLLYSSSKYPESFADSLCAGGDCSELETSGECLLGECGVTPFALRADSGRTLNGYGLKLNYKHNGQNALYWLNYSDFQPDFRADLGFIRQVDIRSVNMAYGRKYYIDALSSDAWKSRARFYGTGGHSRSHLGNEEIDSRISAWAEFSGSFQTVALLGRRYRHRAVNRVNQASLEVGDNAPLFNENYWQWYFETSPFASWTLHLDGRYGDMADPSNMVDGEMVEIKPRLELEFTRLQVKAEGELRWYDTDGSQLYSEQFLTLTLTYHGGYNWTHRLLYKDDLTRRDAERWKGRVTPKDHSRTVEYTTFYHLRNKWRILLGANITEEYDYVSEDYFSLNRGIYCKLERNFQFKL